MSTPQTRRAVPKDGPLAFNLWNRDYFFLPFFAFLADFFLDFLAAFLAIRSSAFQVPVREL